MPGIVGIITRMPRAQAEQLVLRMVDTLRHESFYVTDVWVDEALGVYVAWASRKGSFADGMPVWNERRDVSLVFSGEEFPEPDARRRLTERGHRLDLEGPSYLVHLYEDDLAFPRSLNGRFHGLLADRARGTAILFNDRYGMHRLYYHEAKDAFYFAAEAKAILAVRPELRSIDPRALGEFVACGCVLENRTLFNGICLLPAAATWVFRDGSIQSKNTYFRPREWEEQDPLEPAGYYEELRRVFASNLPRYFDGREQVGIALTGGLDTRMIMAWRTPNRQSLPCYTFGGPYRHSQDIRIARQVARICGQPHEVITVGSEFLSRFSSYAERSVYLTDGCVDLSRSPDLYLSEKARDIAPVKIVGTYGSELLSEVPTFKPRNPAAGLFNPDLRAHIRQAEATYTELRLEYPVTFAAFRQSPWWHHGVLALEETQLGVRTPYLDNDFVQTIFRAPRATQAGADVRLQMISRANPLLGQLRTDRGVSSRTGFLAKLRRSVLEFTFRAEHSYDYAMPQWLAGLDYLLSPLQFERALLGRHKPVHFRVWYRDALADYVREMLFDSRTLSRPYLERAALEVVVHTHLKGYKNYTNDIHKLLTLELIHRLFIDPAAMRER